LEAKAKEVEAVLHHVDGVENARVVEDPKQPEVEITVDLAAAALAGLKPGDVRREASTLFQGLEVGKIFEAQKVFDVVVWSTPESRRNLTEVIDAQFQTPQGGRVRLGDVAKLTITAAPTVIRHEGSSLYLDVAADTANRNDDEIVADVEGRLKSLTFPLGYHFKVLGALAGEAGSHDRAIIAMMVGAIGIVLLLQASFRSWSLALALFLALPIFATGSLIAAAAIGFTTVPAIFANVAVYALALRQSAASIGHFQDLGPGTGLVSGSDRIRLVMRERAPCVVATAICATLALAPAMLFADRPGLEFLAPMAKVIIAGLFTKVAAVLVVVPQLYVRFGHHVEPELHLEGRS
jgi:Cu/Ag efflux pump CusA